MVDFPLSFFCFRFGRLFSTVCQVRRYVPSHHPLPPPRWSAVGVKLKKRGADVLTQQAFVPMEEKLAPGKMLGCRLSRGPMRKNRMNDEHFFVDLLGSYIFFFWEKQSFEQK